MSKLDYFKRTVAIHQKSISFKFNLLLVFAILAIMASWSVYFSLSEKNKVQEQRRFNVTTFANRVVRLMMHENRQLSSDDLKNVMEAELDDQNVLGIALYFDNPASLDKNPFSYLALLKTGRNPEAVSPAQLRTTVDPKAVLFQHDISIRKNRIGRVEYYFTDQYINNDFNFLFIRFSVLTALLFIVLLILLFLSLKNIILKPIRNLDQAVKHFTEKDFSVRAEVKTEDEVGQLGRNFNIMADSIEMYRQEITRQLFVDGLTGLPNRNKIMSDIERAVNPSLILMNVDSFKEINDFYGNKIGDEVLKEIANRLRRLEKDLGFVLYRMNGDEFAVLFDKHFKQEEMKATLKNLEEQMNERPYLISGNDISVRLTAGVALGHDSAKKGISEGRWTRLATNADMALRKAKKKQKDYVIYDESIEIPKEYESNIFWRQRLREAIHSQKLVPYFQPIINNYNGRIEKYESLVRLIDPYGNAIPPAYFLDVAKRAHLYSDITKSMIEKSFPVFHGTNYEFSINLTLFDILDEDMNRYILRKLKENPDVARKLVFEILESEGIENYREVMTFIEEVKDIGCKIAIDDFGSGYSNFEHILRLDVDYIKIDASLIKNLDKDANAQIITRTIANFARKLGLKTISEYVHSKEVYEKTIGLGIDFSQGYYFGEPREFILKPQDFSIHSSDIKIIDTPKDDD